MISFILSIKFTPIAKRMALTFNIVDVPNKEVKTHKEIMPYLGGLSIFASVLITIIIIVLVYKFNVHMEQYGILIGCLIIIVIGLTDDIRNVKPLTKMLFQLIAAYLVWLAGIQINIIGIKSINMFFTLLWIVGLSNAFNLIDIMDGLSSGVAAISSFVLSIILWEMGWIFYCVITVALTGACLGFLKYNFNPAQLFMGDTGSLFIGFLLACISALMTQENETNQFLIPFFIFGIPIFETIFVSLLRIYSGRSPFKGSKDHFALRIVKCGFTVKRTVIWTYLFCVFLGFLSFIIFHFDNTTPYFLFLIIIIYIGIAWILSRVDISNV